MEADGGKHRDRVVTFPNANKKLSANWNSEKNVQQEKKKRTRQIQKKYSDPMGPKRLTPSRDLSQIVKYGAVLCEVGKGICIPERLRHKCRDILGIGETPTEVND